jgi:hypothetical protein
MANESAKLAVSVLVRKARTADGLIYHALNWGNNRAPVFATAADYRAFLRSRLRAGTSPHSARPPTATC